MSRVHSRLVMCAAAGAVLVAAGCGGQSKSNAATTPKGELSAGFQHLADSDVLTATLQLETTAHDLQSYAKASGDKLPTATAQAIAGAQLVIETKGSGTDKAVSLRGVDGGNTLVELRVVDGSLYLQGDLRGILTLAHKENLPPFVQAFVAGKWITLGKDALDAIAGQLGANAGVSGTPSAGPQLLSDLRDALNHDVTVTAAGTDSTGNHLVLTGNVKKLATDLQSAVAKSVPGGSALGQQLHSADVPSRNVTLDAWVKDGSLRKLSLDLVQFADKGQAPAGATLPLSITFAESGDDISAPSGATPIDLTQLGSLIGAFGGGSA
jgi:outer membrane murein-binding lipoprotein Lpp